MNVYMSTLIGELIKVGKEMNCEVRGERENRKEWFTEEVKGKIKERKENKKCRLSRKRWRMEDDRVIGTKEEEEMICSSLIKYNANIRKRMKERRERKQDDFRHE